MSAREVFRLVRTPLTLVILLAVLGYGAWWGYKTVLHVEAAQPDPCVTIAMTDLTPSSVKVTVLNGGSQRGLATTVGKSLRDGGFQVAGVGNTEKTDPTVGQTIIRGAAVDSPEVVMLASWFTNPAIEGDARVDHSVTVLVGDGFQGMTSDPIRSMQIPGGEVCLPSPTPTSSPS